LERIVGSDLRMWDFLVKIYGLGAKMGRLMMKMNLKLMEMR